MLLVVQEQSIHVNPLKHSGNYVSPPVLTISSASFFILC
jgi:hypothetical protein